MPLHNEAVVPMCIRDSEASTLELSHSLTFSPVLPRVVHNQWSWFIVAIYIKIPTLKLGELPTNIYNRSKWVPVTSDDDSLALMKDKEFIFSNKWKSVLDFYQLKVEIIMFIFIDGVHLN